MNGNLADQLQVWGFEEDFILFSDGSFGFGLEVSPLDVSCWDETQINTLASRISQFLNGLPSDLHVQFIQDIGVGNGEVIAAHERLSKESENLVSRTLCAERAKRFWDFEYQGLIPKHTLKLFVRKNFSTPLLKKPKLFSKTSLFQEKAEHRLSHELVLAKQLRDDFSQNLKSLEMSVNHISVETISDLIYFEWNPTRSVPRGEYDPEDVRGSLLFTDAVISPKGFSLSDMHHRVISLKLLPDETFASMALRFRELPFDSRLYLSIYSPDQHKEIAHLQTQRRLAFSMARGKKTGVSDIESETKLQDLETLLEQMIAQGEKVFHVSVNVVLRSKDLGDLEQQVSETLMKFRELGGAEAMEESLAAFDIFLEASLPNARAKERARRVKTSNLADLLPIYGPWSGHLRPSILLRSRMGSLVPFDPFSQDLTNYNHIISGGSGSGKSFLTNLLLLQMLKENPKIFIVDIGGSYRKLCENLGGQNVQLGSDGDLSINPFDLNPGETTPPSQKIKFLVGLLELMTKEDGDARLPRFERAEVEEAIQKTYEKTTTPTLSVLRQILLDHQSPEIRRLGRILTSWCGDSPFGKFLDRQTTIKFHSPVVAFDLKGMENSDLQAVALFIITDLVWRVVQRDRSTKKFLIFDECWKLLENEAGAAFIGEVFRTFRKYFASAIAISQNVDDFAKSKVAGAILSNSSIKWILMQKGADQKRLQEVLQLNDNELTQIASLHQERGSYSEVFLISEAKRAVVCVEPTPLEYWIATTDPRDLSMVESETLKESQLSTLDILKTLAKRFPKGVAVAA